MGSTLASQTMWACLPLTHTVSHAWEGLPTYFRVVTKFLCYNWPSQDSNLKRSAGTSPLPWSICPTQLHGHGHTFLSWFSVPNTTNTRKYGGRWKGLSPNSSHNERRKCQTTTSLGESCTSRSSLIISTNLHDGLNTCFSTLLHSCFLLTFFRFDSRQG